MDDNFVTTNVFYCCGYESGREEERSAILKSAKELGPEILHAVKKAVGYSPYDDVNPGCEVEKRRN